MSSPRPSPREKLAPIHSIATVEQDELWDEAALLSARQLCLQFNAQASEADVAAGDSSCSHSYGAVSATMEIEDSGASLATSSCKQYSWAKELQQLRPLLATPDVAAGDSANPGGEDSSLPSNHDRIGRRQTTEFLAEALDPVPSQSYPKAVRTRRYHHKKRLPPKVKAVSEADMGTTAIFWESYRAAPVVSPRANGPAWQEPSPRDAIAARFVTDDVHGKRRQKLLRLIKTGQLPAAASVATGGRPRQSAPQHDMRERKDEVKKQLEVMGSQRRGLTEARKMLEKLVIKIPEPTHEELAQNLRLLTRGSTRHHSRKVAVR